MSNPIPPTETLSNRKIGAHWTPSNLTTLIDWLWTSIYIIECLEISIIHSRNTLRYNTILGLILSTLTGTLNITQFNLIEDYYVNLVIKIFLTLMAFTITVNTGRIKIYQYQESLEDYIRIKQEWIQFAVNIATELQLPIDLRQDALYIIENYKGKYLDLLKAESEIGEHVKEKIRKMMESDDIKFNHLIQKYNYIMDMKDNSDFDLNVIIDEYDKKIHTTPIINRNRKSNENELVNKMVKNFLNGNQVSVYGVKISNLILNLAFKEKFDLNILQRQDFYDSDMELTQLYDLLSSMEMNKKSHTTQTQNALSPSYDLEQPTVFSRVSSSSSPVGIGEKKTHMPRIKSPSKQTQSLQQPKPQYPLSSILSPPVSNNISLPPRSNTPPTRIPLIQIPIPRSNTPPPPIDIKIDMDKQK
jgi:hypothetical protein